MSDDEFDIVDDFANIEGVDWDALLPGPSPSTNSDTPQGLSEATLQVANRSPSVNSSHYSFDDLDQVAFAEVDNLERDTVQALDIPSSITADTRSVLRTISIPPSSLPQQNSTATCSPFFPDRTGSPQLPRGLQASMKRKVEGDLDSAAFRKKQRSGSSPLKPQSPRGKGKGRANENVQQVLSEFEDEFTCPICCDIFVAAHLGNPCGHSFCGDCGWQWSTTKNKDSCAICRTKLSKSTPMIPNIAMDNIVERHIQALGTNGDKDWRPGGAKYVEWNLRKEKWKKDVATRGKKGAVERGKKRKVVEVIDVMDLMYWMVPDDEHVGDYEEEEVDADGSGGELRMWESRRTGTRV